MSAGLSGMAEGSAEFFIVLIFVRNGIFRAYLGT